jgi:anti-sigma factor RsiW
MASDEHDHKHCVAMFEKLSEYIDGELDGPFAKEIESHIEVCAACKICLATLKTTIRMCSSISKNPVPETLSQKVRILLQENLPAGDGPAIYKR